MINRMSAKSIRSTSTTSLAKPNRVEASVVSDQFPRPPSIVLISNKPIDSHRSTLRQSSYASIASDNARYNAWKQSVYTLISNEEKQRTMKRASNVLIARSANDEKKKRRKQYLNSVVCCAILLFIILVVFSLFGVCISFF